MADFAPRTDEDCAALELTWNKMIRGVSQCKAWPRGRHMCWAALDWEHDLRRDAYGSKVVKAELRRALTQIIPQDCVEQIWEHCGVETDKRYVVKMMYVGLCNVIAASKCMPFAVYHESLREDLLHIVAKGPRSKAIGDIWVAICKGLQFTMSLTHPFSEDWEPLTKQGKLGCTLIRHACFRQSNSSCMLLLAEAAVHVAIWGSKDYHRDAQFCYQKTSLFATDPTVKVTPALQNYWGTRRFSFYTLELFPAHSKLSPVWPCYYVVHFLLRPSNVLGISQAYLMVCQYYDPLLGKVGTRSKPPSVPYDIMACLPAGFHTITCQSDTTTAPDEVVEYP